MSAWSAIRSRRGSTTISVVPRRRACLKNEGHRVVRRRVRSREDRDVGVDDVAVGRGHRAGADALEQRRHARRVAQTRAVVHVVRAEARADQLLEEVGLLVRALRGAEARDRPRAAFGVDRLQLRRHEVERLVPARLAEVRQHLAVVHEPAGLVRRPRPSPRTSVDRGPFGIRLLAPDQRRGEPLGRARVVPAVAALHAQAPLRARAARAPRRTRSRCAPGPRGR